MKTIEEKAKAYDEALERAKQIRNGNPSSGTAIVVCEQIFPELAESEDERIRKEMIKYFTEIKSTVPIGSPNHFDRYIAYLEKQERKPIIKGWVARDKALQLNFYTNKPKRGKTHWIENGGDSVQIMPDTEHLYEEQNFDTLDWKDEPIEVELVVRASTEKRQEHVPENEETDTRQEQKPAWSEEDTLMLTAIIQTLERFEGRGTTGMQIDWIKSLPERFNIQPKQEWSDGNKQWFDAIIKDYEDLLSGDEDHDPAIQIKINLLKSLRPQPKVDSVEYERGFLAGQGSIQHWKPSEEQMEAFEESLMSVAYTENKIILESLLEQLKKLCQ